MITRSRLLGSTLAAAIVLMSAHAWSAPPTKSDEVEVTPAAASLLNLVNTGSAEALKSAPGLRPEVVTRILAHRTSGSRFKNLVELVQVTKINHKDLETALKPYQEEQEVREFEAQRKPVPEPAASGKAGGKLRRGEGEPGAAAAGGQSEGAQAGGPIAQVRPGFYGKLPGYDDLDKIDPIKRSEFLETINREMCSCGCVSETLAFCLVNDPKCPVVKSRAKKIYEDIMSKTP